MTELEIEELETNLAGNDNYKEEERSADDTGSNSGEEERYFDSIRSRWGDCQSWGRRAYHYCRNNRSVLERRRKDKFPALRDIPIKRLLEETAKVDKVLCKFKTHSITTKSNELFYAGTVVVTNRLGVKINKAAERKEPMWRRWLRNKIKELRKDLSQ